MHIFDEFNEEISDAQVKEIGIAIDESVRLFS